MSLPGSHLEAEKMHPCVPEGEGIERASESQCFLWYGMGPASRGLLGLSMCRFPPALPQFSRDVFCSSVCK